MKKDSQLQHDVMKELEWEPRIDAAHIGVAAKDGVITLSHARNLVDFGFIGHSPSGERVEGLAFRQNGSLASANIGLAVGFRIVRRRRTRSVQHHAFGPFVIRMDPDVDLLIERNIG